MSASRSDRNRLRRWLPGWLFAALLAGDLALNILAGGTPGETVSERLGRHRDNGSVAAAVLCLPLELIEPDHCTRVLR